MSNNETHNNIIRDFISVFENDIDKNSFEYNGSELRFTCQKNHSSNLNIFKNIFKNVQELSQGKIEIKLPNCKLDNTFFYFDEDDYIRNYDYYKNKFDNSN